MSSATSGALVRSSDSEQPVHSWKCSQITGGLAPPAAFSAIFSPAHAGSPTAPAARVHTLRKPLRETPFVSSSAMKVSRELIALIPASDTEADSRQLESVDRLGALSLLADEMSQESARGVPCNEVAVCCLILMGWKPQDPHGAKARIPPARRNRQNGALRQSTPLSAP